MHNDEAIKELDFDLARQYFELNNLEVPQSAFA